MNQNNTYLCDEFLGAVYFQIKHTQKYLKKKFEINIYLYIYIYFSITSYNANTSKIEYTISSNIEVSLEEGKVRQLKGKEVVEVGLTIKFLVSLCEIISSLLSENCCMLKSLGFYICIENK